jgi:hypothetical protein
MIDILATGLPTARTPEREAEYLKSLKANIECQHVAVVMVLVEEGTVDVGMERLKLLDHPKVKTVQHGSRAMWADYQDYLNGIAKTGQLVGLCNADTWVDDTMGNLLAWEGSWDKTLIALSREAHPNLGSTDLWLWRSPLNLTNVAEPLGVKAVDGRVIGVAQRAGYLVLNPCVDVFLHHEHAGEHPADKQEWIGPPWGFSYLLRFGAQPED